MIGERFGMLVVEAIGENQGRRSVAICQCDCGSRKPIRIDNIKSGNSKNCGCLRNKKASDRMRAAKTTHGLSDSIEWRSWRSMLRRCLDPKNRGWHLYGGRGITVCKRWRESFKNFYADMAPRPSKLYTLDRIDVNGDYEPSNCRWATAKQQNRNSRTNVVVEYGGIKKCLVERAEEYRLCPVMLRYRLLAGWDVGTALTKPSRQRGKHAN